LTTAQRQALPARTGLPVRDSGQCGGQKPLCETPNMVLRIRRLPRMLFAGSGAPNQEWRIMQLPLFAYWELDFIDRIGVVLVAWDVW